MPVIGAPPVFLFEPHQPEQCNWKPDVLLDISAVWEKKQRAFTAADVEAAILNLAAQTPEAKSRRRSARAG